MASAQVDATHVEEFTKHSEDTTFESPTIDGPEKAPAPQSIKSPYDDDDDDDDEDDIVLPDELGKEEDLDDDKDQKALEPQIIEDEDEDEDDDDDDYNDEDDRAQAEEQASKAGSRATDFLGEDDD